jgi:hypothetical protein
MRIRRMRIACWITKATNTHSQYLIPTIIPLQQWLQEWASLLHYVYIACLVMLYVVEVSYVKI